MYIVFFIFNIIYILYFYIIYMCIFINIIDFFWSKIGINGEDIV